VAPVRYPCFEGLRAMAAGSNADAKALADRIISAQEAEIATMQKLLAGGK